MPVNVTVPAVGAERAHEIVRAAAARTAKVKVAEPGQTLADDQARLEAVRDALGPDGRVRVDANGGWCGRRGGRRDPAAGPRGRRPGVRRAAVRDPSRSWPPYAGAVDVPIAADESIRRAADPYRVRDLEAADVAVLKVQPLGGVRACLRIAEDIGLPVVVSSALETSVGIAAGVALAAALPELPYACGLATVQLLTDDVAVAPLLPVDGALPVGPAEVDEAALNAAGGASRSGSRPGRPGWPRSARCGRITARDEPLDRAGPRGGHGAGRRPGSPRSCSPRARATRRSRSRRTTRPRPGCSACTPGSTSGPPASSRSD